MSLVRIQSPRPIFALDLEANIVAPKPAGGPHPSMIAVPLRYRRAQRGLFLQKLQHAVPSIVVLSDGLAHLSHDPHGIELALGVFEVGAALLVMGSVVRGIRQLKKRAAADAHPHHHGVDWIDIFIGVMLSVEAYAKYHATAHIPRPTILLAVTMFTVGLTHGRLAAWGDRKRELRVGPEGISLPTTPFMRMTLAWADVESIEIGDRDATITAVDGRSTRVDLSDVLEPAAVRDALMTANTFLDEARHAASASIESAAADA
jgi:hypothetical protein